MKQDKVVIVFRLRRKRPYHFRRGDLIRTKEFPSLGRAFGYLANEKLGLGMSAEDKQEIWGGTNEGNGWVPARLILIRYDPDTGAEYKSVLNLLDSTEKE